MPLRSVLCVKRLLRSWYLAHKHTESQARALQTLSSGAHCEKGLGHAYARLPQHTDTHDYAINQARRAREARLADIDYKRALREKLKRSGAARLLSGLGEL